MVLFVDLGRFCVRLLRTVVLKYYLKFKFFENIKKMWVRELLMEILAKRLLLIYFEDLEVIERVLGKWLVKKLVEKKKSKLFVKS